MSNSRSWHPFVEAPSVKTTRRSMAGRAVLCLAIGGLFGVGCGLKPVDNGEDQSGAGGQSFGSGGQVAVGSGGQTSTGTGGAASGSGGAMAPGTGGQSSGAGGQGSSTGGRTGTQTGGSNGSGGQGTGSGGQTSGTGGQTSGTGGQASGTGGASSGTGVTINGKFVPKEKAVVFIHFGHSNMRGQATKPTSLMSYFYTTQDGLWSYNAKGFSLAKEPTAPEGTMNFAGPGMAILHSAKSAVASTSDVQFISIGYGRGSVTTVDYQKGTTNYNTFVNWAKQLKGNVTFGGIVVMLGLTDGEHLPAAQVPDFPTRMAQIISDIRTDIGDMTIPVLFCDYEAGATGTLAPTGAIGTQMTPLIRGLAKSVSKLAIVPTDGLEMQDDHHFDMQGQKDWAARVIMVMQTNGWFPWK